MNVNDFVLEPITVGSNRAFKVSYRTMVLGFIEKMHSNSSSIHPWKAFSAVHGQYGKLLVASYAAGRLGKAEALEAILKHAIEGLDG